MNGVKEVSEEYEMALPSKERNCRKSEESEEVSLDTEGEIETEEKMAGDRTIELGAVANVLVTNGTLNVGDVVLCEQYSGRIKVLIDAAGNKVKLIGPSFPAKVVGMSGVPMAGAAFRVYKNEKTAAALAGTKADTNRTKGLSRTTASSLEDLFSNIKN